MTSYSTKILTLTIAANTLNFPIELEGQSISYVSGTPTVDVRLNSRGNDPIPIGPFDRVVLPQGMSFKKAYISANTGTGTIKLMISGPDVKIEAGNVNVSGDVNSSYERFRQGVNDKIFTAYHSHAVIATNYNCAIQNSSSNSLGVRRVEITHDVDTTAFVLLQATGHSAFHTGGSSGVVYPRLTSGTNPLPNVAIKTGVAGSPTLAAIFGTPVVKQNDDYLTWDNTDIIIAPAHELFIQSSLTFTLTAYFAITLEVLD